MSKSFKPEGHPTVVPYLAVPEIRKLIEFLKVVFVDVEVLERFERDDKTIMHAQVKIGGDSIVMMGEPHGETKAFPAMIYVYVEDTDAVYHRALRAGATSVMKPTDQFYGDRNAGVQDQWGNQWWIATHKEDVSQEEMKKRLLAQAAH